MIWHGAILEEYAALSKPMPYYRVYNASSISSFFMARNPNDQLSRARMLLQGGNAPGAQVLIDGVLARAPANPEANYLLGMIRLMAGDARAAEAPLQVTLRSDPNNGMALDSLGLCYLMQRRFNDAEQVLRKAAANPRAPAVVVMRFGLALLEQRKAAEAVGVLQRAATMAPRDADCQLTLGRALHAAGNSDAARQAFETALALAPGNADAIFNVGVIFIELNQIVTAIEWFEKCIACAPQHAEAWVNLGIAHERSNALNDALAAYRKALEIDPRLPAAGNNLAHGLALLHRHDEARLQYLATLQVAPDYIAAHQGLAASCLALGRIEEAVAHLRITLAAEPDNRDAVMALANALFEAGKLDEAEPLAQRARELNPDAADTYVTLANLQGVRGNAALSVPLLEAGYQRTHNGGLLGMLAYQYRVQCDWGNWARAWETLAPRIERDAALGSPFWLLCQPATAQQQLTYTTAWAAERFKNIRPMPAAAPRTQSHSRLRIGYLSSDLHEHATAYLIAEVLERHDRSRFEIFAYSYGIEDHSPMRARLRAGCEHFVDIAWETDDAAAARIRADAIDVLVDLKGYTMGDRVTILARRPCANQVTWLGFPGTTGTPHIDYVIADNYVIPPGAEAAYAERVLRMPYCYQPNDRKRVVAAPRSRGEYGLPDKAFVFCCFNQSYKFTPEIYAMWMRLLKRVPGSVLWMVDIGAAAQRNLIEAAHEHGVMAEQLVFAPRLPNAEHLARYCVADLALDTFPYTSHTTLSDALWCGCPAIGLSGETFASRVSGSLLMAAGLVELIVHSIEDYESLAYRVAKDAPLLHALREKVAHARNASPLFDSTGFTGDLESLLESIVAKPQ